MEHTVANLYQLKYTGGFDKLTEQFGDILSEGENPRQDVLVHAYVSRFP